MAYKCECGEIFEKPVPSYREVLKFDGNTEKVYECDCCPDCGSRIFKEVPNDEL